MRKHWKRILAIVLAVLFVAYNGVAFSQAWAMTHYAPGGSKTGRPESLGGWGKLRVLILGVNLPRPVNRKTPADRGLPFATVRIPSRDGMDLEAWVITNHAPRAVAVLFHGYGGARASLLPEAQTFHELGCHVVMVDFRGSGGSPGHTTTIGYREAEDVVATLAFARKTWGGVLPCVVHGNSMGAAAALRAVAVLGAVPDAIIAESVFDRLLTAIENRFRSMRVPPFPSARFLTFWGGVQHGINTFRLNPCDYAAAVTCPTLMLHGEDDPRATLAQAKNVFDALRGPKRMVTFAKAIHEPLIEIDPVLWKASVSRFLDSAIAGSGRGSR